jgi:hypothetical protein
MRRLVQAPSPLPLGALARRAARWLAAALWLLLAWLPAGAHDVAGELRVQAFTRVVPGPAGGEGAQLQVLLRVPLELTLNVDLPKRGSGYLDLVRVEEGFPRALQATLKGFGFSADGQRLVPVESTARIALPDDPSFQGFDRAWSAVRHERLPVTTDVYWNQGWFDAAFTFPLPRADASLAVDFGVAPGLRDRLRLELRAITPAGDTRAFTLQAGDGPVVLDPSWHQAAATFTVSGLRHILGGADHLLFLLCLVLPFARIGWPLVGVVTAFTVAHSVTLLAAAFGLVPSGAWFPPLVEVAIAASIIFMALENVLGADLSRRWALTAAFGLVHGFGFSFGLAHEMQFAGSHLLVSLLAFNIGIELGQLAVLALVWPVLAWLRSRAGRQERLLVGVASAFIAHEAWHWLGERWQALAATGGPDWQAVAATALVALAGALAWQAWKRRGVPVARAR